MNENNASSLDVPSQEQDTLILLIFIVRKLKHMIPSQVIKTTKQIFNICKQNDAVCSLKSLFFQGISCINPINNPDVLHNIMNSLPSKKQINTQQALTLLTIPLDLRMHTFQYLYESDLYQLTKTCHTLNTDASVNIDMNQVDSCQDKTEHNLRQLSSISRKLHECNKLELVKSIEAIINIIQDNCLLELVLVAGFCCCHRKIGANILNKILTKLPNEEILSIDDSITNSGLIIYQDKDEDDDDDEIHDETLSLSLLRMPLDLRIYILQYLQESDTQLVCRSLFIDGRNPNSNTDIHIKYLHEINTLNKRYFKAKSIFMHCKLIDNRYIMNKFPNLRILPLSKPFNQLMKFKCSLQTFAETRGQFKSLLNLVYSLLANGQTNKIFEFACAAVPSHTAQIFNSVHNILAAEAIHKIGCLSLYGPQTMSIAQNIYATLNTDKNKNKIFDKLQIEFSNSAFTDIDWDWPFIRSLCNRAKTVLLKLRCWVMNPETLSWNPQQWINNLSECGKGFCDELCLTVEMDDPFLDQNGVKDFKNHFMIWINSMDKIMKKIERLKSFVIQYEYSINNFWELVENAGCLQEWNELAKTLIPDLQTFCWENCGVTYVENKTNDRTLIIKYKNTK